MMDLSEVYVLCEERSAEVAMRFLNKFLPARTDVADDYYYPENVDEPTFHAADAVELIAHLTQMTTAKYGIYWDQAATSEPSQAMLFFTDDGAMIAGLAVPAESSKTFLGEVAKCVRGRFGMACSEERPPDSAEEFIQLCRKSEFARIVDGMLLE